MMLPFHAYAQLFEHQTHFGANVLLSVHGCDREVAFFVANFVAQVRHLVATGIPNGLFGIDAVERAIGFVIKLHVVKDEEFRFRSTYGTVSDPR